MADESQLKILNQGVSALGTADFPLQSPIFGQGGLR